MWRCPPEIDSIILCAKEILESAFQTVIMDLVWTRIGLGEFHTIKCQVRMTGCHSPDLFANTSAIRQLHFFCQQGLHLNVRIAGSFVKFFPPHRISWERCRPCARRVHVLHPGSQIFLTNFIDQGCAGELNVVPHLKDVNAIIHIQMTLPFDGNGKAFVQ